MQLKGYQCSLNGIAGVIFTSELASETAETMIRQTVLLELEKQSKIIYGPAERENQFQQSKISSEEKVKVHKS